MECHDVQQLLAFVNRKSEDLDAAERDAIREHLDKCPDCSARADAEQRADETLGVVMRDVSVPAGLKQRVLNRLTAERGAARWKTMKRGVLAAAAAALLIGLVGGFGWYYQLPTAVTPADADSVMLGVNNINKWDENSAKEFLKAHGLSDKLPPKFDWRTLQSVEVISFKGRPVAKLTFAKGADIASVVMLPCEYFRIHENLGDDLTSRKIEIEDRIIYLILFQGNLDMLRPPPNFN